MGNSYSNYIFHYSTSLLSNYLKTRMRSISLWTSIVAVFVVWFIILGQLENVIAIFEEYNTTGLTILLLVSGILAVLWIFKIKELIERP